MEILNLQNNPEPVDPSQKLQTSEDLWRQRVNRLLNRRCLNFRGDHEDMEADDDELKDLANEGKRLGYKLD